jgi:hypothetical protein
MPRPRHDVMDEWWQKSLTQRYRSCIDQRKIKAQIGWSVRWAACDTGLSQSGSGGRGRTGIWYKHSSGRGHGADIVFNVAGLANQL